MRGGRRGQRASADRAGYREADVGPVDGNALVAGARIRSVDAVNYVSLVGGFLITVGDIGITLALYLTGIAALYVALGKTTWWKLLRLDAPVGGALLLVLAIAFFGRAVAIECCTARRPDYRGIRWLIVIIVFTLLVVTVGVVVTVLYTKNKLAKKGEGLVRAMGKVRHIPPLFSLFSHGS